MIPSCSSPCTCDRLGSLALVSAMLFPDIHTFVPLGAAHRRDASSSYDAGKHVAPEAMQVGATTQRRVTAPVAIAIRCLTPQYNTPTQARLDTTVPRRITRPIDFFSFLF